MAFAIPLVACGISWPQSTKTLHRAGRADAPAASEFAAMLPRKESIVRLKKLLGAVAVVLTLTVGATGCGSRGGTAESSSSANPSDSLVGISMPTQTSERWIAD